MHKEHFDANVLEIFPNYLINFYLNYNTKLFILDYLPLILGGAELTRPA
jgi:hypothetical protein